MLPQLPHCLLRSPYRRTAALQQVLLACNVFIHANCATKTLFWLYILVFSRVIHQPNLWDKLSHELAHKEKCVGSVGNMEKKCGTWRKNVLKNFTAPHSLVRKRGRNCSGLICRLLRAPPRSPGRFRASTSSIILSAAAENRTVTFRGSITSLLAYGALTVLAPVRNIQPTLSFRPHTKRGLSAVGRRAAREGLLFLRLLFYQSGPQSPADKFHYSTPYI